MTSDLVAPRPRAWRTRRRALRWSSASIRRASGRAFVAAALIAAGCSSAPKQVPQTPANSQILAYRGPDGVWKDQAGDVAMPVLTHHVNPQVPPDRGDAVSGTVELKARVSGEGVVEEVVVIKSLSRAMDQEAITAVRQWRYRPATLAGQPVAVWLRVTVTYHFTG